MNSSLDLKTINDLLGMHFFIPSYQRGYRWVPLQVNDSLNDIWDFVKKGKDGEFYCLQPIVVKIRNQANNVDTAQYEVIYGQQRLTTIFIILQYIMHEYFRTDTLVSEYGKEIFRTI
ncbi:MAG: DUF262 domain-containing protein [Firmicutes bacterium]|nr:DUF262 domain-containing protein [Bacillota bacterium]